MYIIMHVTKLILTEVRNYINVFGPGRASGLFNGLSNFSGTLFKTESYRKCKKNSYIFIR